MNDWLEHHRTLVLSSIGLLIILGLGAVGLRWQKPASIVIQPPLPTATPGPIRVYVSGAVANPDVYTIAPDGIVRDALTAAGGPAPDADLNRVNLAGVLHDGDQVNIPRIGEMPTSAPEVIVEGQPGASGPVNINTASVEELEALPEIGPALAQRIIDYREANGPFPNIEAIQNVSGIGPATFQTLQPLITVE
jgi:competence protein ComEA